jgi:hypothetical protein
MKHLREQASVRLPASRSCKRHPHRSEITSRILWGDPMTIHDWLLLLIGGVFGSAVTTATMIVTRQRRSRNSGAVTASLPETSPAKPLTNVSTPPADTARSSPPTTPTGSQVEFEVSPTGGITYRGPKWGIVVACLLVALVVVGIVLMVRRDDKPPQITFNPTITITDTDIRTKLDNGVHDDRYDVDLHPNPEVVAGLVGSYYVIDLKDVRAKRSLFFAPEEYTRDEFAADFRSAMTKFRSDVLHYIDNSKVPYRIFVRGSADASGNAAPYLNELLDHAPRSVSYFPMVPDNANQFQQTMVTEMIPVQYANRHLPFLRAAYVQEKLRALQLSSTLLEGTVTSNADAQADRNATMLLFVQWPAKEPQKSDRRLTSR